MPCPLQPGLAYLRDRAPLSIQCFALSELHDRLVMIQPMQVHWKLAVSSTQSWKMQIIQCTDQDGQAIAVVHT